MSDFIASTHPLRERDPRAGASLIEVVIATLIVSIIAIGTVEFFAKGRFWFDQEEAKRVAVLLAQETMERSAGLPFDQIVPFSETRPVEGIDFAVEVTVEDNAPEANVKTLRSVVTWRAAAGANRTVSLATLVFNN